MNLIIVTSVNEAYIPVGLNWLKAVTALGLAAKIHVIALDEATRDAFPESVVLFHPLAESDFWVIMAHRTRILCMLLDQGFDIIHSDADAVWVHDPLAAIMESDTEMVFSQGTVWPRDVHAQHGVVVCCGLFYLKNSPSVRAFFAQIEDRVRQYKSDQMAINRQINEGLVRWIIEEPYSIAYRNTAFIASRVPMLAEVLQGPSISVLPHHRFPRVVERLDKDVMVAHPISGKTCTETKDILSQLGLWFINPKHG